ncbi:hypothetical protein [Spirosoma fluminis]
MSWGQYCLLQKGYWDRKNREWEQGQMPFRRLYWVLYNSNVEKGHQRTEEQLWPLPSDKKLADKSTAKAKPKSEKEVLYEQEVFFAVLSHF